MSRPTASMAESVEPAEPPTASPVDWDLAERIGVRLAGRSPRPPESEQPDAAQMSDLVALAEQLVADDTGLRPPTPANAQVLSREDWVRANLRSFRGLLAPLWTRVAEAGQGSALRTWSSSVGPQLAAAQIGGLLGWMSSRVLGQYDALVTGEGQELDAEGNGVDFVYVVGPNMAALEQRFAFGPEQFRLWVALHEVTHRAQFRGVPWMHDHYRGLVDEALTVADPDPARLWAALRSAANDREASRAALRDGGALALLAPPEQRAVLARIAGLMSLLEGHGDVTMDRAGAGHVPDAARFSHVLKVRRQNASPLARVVQRLIGLEAKLEQYRAGEEFIAAVEAERGPHGIDRCWEAAVNLPTIDEIRRPAQWLERVG